MGYLLQADLLKTSKRPLGWGMLAVLLVFATLMVLVATFGNEEIRSQISFAFPNGLLLGAQLFNQFGGIMLLALGANLVGSEYGYDTWKNLLTRHVSRPAFILSKWLVMLFATLFAVLVVVLWSQGVGTLFATLFAPNNPTATESSANLLPMIAVQLIQPLVLGGIGMLGAVIGRSTIIGVVVGFVWLIADSLLSEVLPEALQGLTLSMNEASLTMLVTGQPALFSPLASLFVVLFYLIAPLLVAMLIFRQRDMVGV
jgi:ABC-type transport system involved in multi-copper enzyme maturation permease subunit